MARRKSASFKRDIGVDPRYGSESIQKLINVVMRRGKKNVARKIVYDALDLLGKKFGGDPAKTSEVFDKVLEKTIPIVEVKARRVGGSVYQVPKEVAQGRGRALAFRWLIDSASKRENKTMGLRLGHEFVDAYEGRGGAIKKRTDVHKMAESNRAFSHLSW